MRRSTGLDWDALRSAHDARVALETPPGPPAPPAPEPVSEPRSKPRRTATRPPLQTPKYDPEVIRRLYVDERLSTRQVAARLGAHYSTIARRTRIMGISRTEDRHTGHPPTKDECVRGHRFTPENTRAVKGGGRSCKECERIRGREFKRRQRRVQSAA